MVSQAAIQDLPRKAPGKPSAPGEPQFPFRKVGEEVPLLADGCKEFKVQGLEHMRCTDKTALCRKHDT